MLRATVGPRATMHDVREGTYLSGQKRLWYVLAVLENKHVVIEDCGNPDDPPAVWAPSRFLTTWGPMEVVRPPA